MEPHANDNELNLTNSPESEIPSSTKAIISSSKISFFLSDKSLNLSEENVILRNNVRELQEQLQNAYNRIIELQYVKDKQMELFK